MSSLPMAGAAELVEESPAGGIRVNPVPVPEQFLNPWPGAWEEGFWKRANGMLEVFDASKYGNTFFENEKSSYPAAFIDFLKGNRQKALKFLQAPDGDLHAQKATLSVDWFPSFTIKSQVRKYFLFGPYLEDDYRKRMYDSAKLWTEKDPLRRPNAVYKGGSEGWTPSTKNSWVDVRNTDNLRAMRECAVYLMAEETGNKEVAGIYRERIRAYVTALFNTGMGEWDSVNYLAHTFTGYLQLYDFAKDPETRMLGKAALDWLSAAAAVKYYRGNWAGPNKRDYSNLGMFAGAAGEFWLYFDDTGAKDTNPYRDFVHMITSSYRPPAAVVELARKNFPKPVEILSTKPSYDGWYTKPRGEEAPEFFETLYVSEAYQVGTLPTGHTGDANGFRLATWTEAGSDIWVLMTALDGHVSTASAGGDQIAQNGNLIIAANPDPATNFHLLGPDSVKIEERDGVVFFDAGKAWIAMRPVNLRPAGINPQATEWATVRKGKPTLPGYQVWSAEATEGREPVALVLELGDAATHDSFDAFVKAVVSRGRLDISKLGDGAIDYTGSDGRTVGLRMKREGGLPTVLRDGRARDWKTEWALYTGGGGEPSPITLGWKEGTLEVKAGGRSFTGRLENGRYQFQNSPVRPE